MLIFPDFLHCSGVDAEALMGLLEWWLCIEVVQKAAGSSFGELKRGGCLLSILPLPLEDVQRRVVGRQCWLLLQKEGEVVV